MDCIYLDPVEAGDRVAIDIFVEEVYNKHHKPPSIAGNVKIYIDGKNVTMRCVDAFSQTIAIGEIRAKVNVKTNDEDGGKQCVVVYEFEIDGNYFTRNYSFFILEKKEMTILTDRLNELERIEEASKKLIKNVHPYMNESGVIKHSLHDWGRFITEVEDI